MIKRVDFSNPIFNFMNYYYFYRFEDHGKSATYSVMYADCRVSGSDTAR